MNRIRYISNIEYNELRKNLLSDNDEVIKMAIQRLITQFEMGRMLNQTCKKDLCAVLFDITSNNSYKIRKWLYHLVIYAHTPQLIDRCIQNLISDFEKDTENISWIVALASFQNSEEALLQLYNRYIKGKISPNTYAICSTLFSREFYPVDLKMTNQIVSAEDFLSKMWLTKVYACEYPTPKKNQYTQIVDYRVMNTLLDDSSVQRYALWAFSAAKEVDVSKINIRPYNCSTLPIKSLAWYYNALFRDENYVHQNEDHITEILNGFLSYKPVLQLGILRGLENAVYPLNYLSEQLIPIYLELDEDSDDHIPLILSLTQVFVEHEDENDELGIILDDQETNTKRNDVKRILLYRPKRNRKGVEKVGIGSINIYGGGNSVQNVENAHTVTQGNLQSNLDALNPAKIQLELDELKNRVELGEFDASMNSEPQEWANFAEKVQFGFRSISYENQATVAKLNEINATLNDLLKVSGKERKSTFSELLTRLAQLCTVALNQPKIWPVLQDTVGFIKRLFHVS